MKKVITSLMVLTVVGLVTANCVVTPTPGAEVAGPPAPEQTTIRLAYSESIYSTTAVVAQEKGFFAEENLLVNAFPQPYGGLALQSLVGGSTDFAVASNSRFVGAAVGDLPIKAIGITTYGFQGQLIVPKSDTTTEDVEDLVGKRVAVQMGSGTSAVVLRYLDSKGLSADDFEIVNIDTEQIPAAFEAGEVDGGFPWEPFASQIVEAGFGRMVLDYPDIAEPVNATYAFPVMTSDELIEEQPEVVQRFVNAWAKAMAWIEEHPEETLDIMKITFFNQGIDISAEPLRDMLEYTHYDRVCFTTEDVEDATKTAEIFVELGKHDHVPDLESFVDRTFCEKTGMAQ